MDNVYLKDFSIDIHKKRKPNHYLLLLATCPDLEVIQFWFVKNICQVCKLIFLFWTFFGNIDIDIFPFVALLKIFYNSSRAFTFQICIFGMFWRLPKLFGHNIFQNIFTVMFIYQKKQKKQQNLFSKNFHNTGSVGRRKLPNPRCMTFYIFYEPVCKTSSYLNNLTLG